MHVLVTGAGGFVGRAVVARALAMGHGVTGIDVPGAPVPAGATAIVGDLADRAVRDAALAAGFDALIHLATVPGGAAEADPALSRRINVDAMYDLLAEAGTQRPGLRVVFASSIAVFGDPLPARVDDATPLAPRMIYGGHKAMMEQAMAMFSHRGLIDGISLRLPGILARPQGPSGLKSAFLSDLFHALRAGREAICPVSAQGTIWAQSLECCAANLVHALACNTAPLPPTRALTLPALRLRMSDLADEIARQCAVSPGLVRFVPDAALEAAFAAQPPLFTPAAEAAGFCHDGDAARLVARALAAIEQEEMGA